ncbi:MAG TPA: EF-hand domain-containing protein [Pirellulales bacterium]|nr:EF-hand domain-containing protein [Pirellulales bacterium]
MGRIAKALSLVLIGCGIWSAQPQRACAAEPQQSAKATDPGVLFDELDTGQKGTLSADQLPPDKRGLFERLLRLAGKPAGGQLTRAEFVAQLKSITDPPPAAASSSPAGSSNSESSKTSKLDIPASPTPARKQIDPGKLFDRLDKDHKGKLSIDDVPEPRQKLLKRLLRQTGKPEDGSLTKQEFVKAVDTLLKKGQTIGAGKGAGKKAAAPAAGQSFDVDKLVSRLMQRSTRADGKLTKSDLPDRMQTRFEKIDENHDGLVDENELRAWLTKVKRQLMAAKALGVGSTAGTSDSLATKSSEK